MGLQYGYDETTGKWYAKGLFFLRLYDTKEEMENDQEDALERYFEMRDTFHGFAMALAALR